MKQKSRRFEIIRKLVAEKKVGSQEQVRRYLHDEGIDVTQATLSRDLKQLKVAKASTPDGKYVFVLPNDALYRRVNKQKDILKMLNTTGFLSINVSNSLAVIRTRPGYAGSIAYNIDACAIPGVLGSIAGDDTIFVALTDDEDREKAIKLLQKAVSQS